jgi:hypothetical protein
MAEVEIDIAYFKDRYLHTPEGTEHNHVKPKSA